ncbi:MAG: TonB-dependent receptor [Bacteroidia bacterium]|nr:TonB-dependent receptor [Bacteroidia bacterium]
MKKVVFVLALLMLQAKMYAQFTIKGKVINQQEQVALPGATVVIEGLLTNAITDLNGNFKFKNLKPGNYLLKVLFIGYETNTQAVTLEQNQELTIALTPKEIIADEVIISAVRAGEKYPIAFTTINKEELAKKNMGQDMPFLLNTTPSVVVSSDAGNGIGYTGIQIRGSDPTRVNVTVNGIPINDAESQGLFWVNMPDFASSVNSIQIQRGAGTSTNGASAFGASVNMQTTTLNKEAYAEIANSFGSFNTLKNTINIGSGLLNNKFTFEGRLSRISSDGYIHPGWSNLQSYYLSGTYYGKKSSLRFITFSGKEKTYQAWNGLRDTMLTINRRANEFTYADQTDNYQQDHYQIQYTYELNKNLSFNAALHYTKGKGYYEEFKKNDKLSKYNLNPIIIGNTTITKSDIVRRRWLDNDFYGTVWNVNYTSNSKHLSLILGGGYNQYTGAHFGEIIWARFAQNSFIHQKYYRDSAFKNDLNIYLKANYSFTKKIAMYADVQCRSIDYSFLGYNSNLQNVQQQIVLNFLNPKAGLTYTISERQYIYASWAVANKEPNRKDYTESSPLNRPKPETMQDVELGYKYNSNHFVFGMNAYNMKYKNQLILTGQINDVGAYNRTNISKSYRRGIELEAGVLLLKKLTVSGNITLSENKVINYIDYVDNYDTGLQDSIIYNKTNISFSPAVIASSIITYNAIKNLDINFISKYVGKQYLDNTSNNTRIINAYFINDIRVDYKLSVPNYFKEIRIGFLAANVFNKLYENNGYTFSYVSGGQKNTENFYYPQAGRNFLGSLIIKF